MFKFFIPLACVFLFVGYSLATGNRPSVQFRPEVTSKIQAAIKGCMKDFGNIPDFQNLLVEGRYREDESFQNFIHCTYLNSGFSHENGRIKIKEAATLYPSEYKIDDVMAKCDKEIGNTAVETSFKFFKCYQINAPVLMDLQLQSKV